MAWLENLFLSSWNGTKPSFYRRFIDDIFYVWRGTKEELEKFISFVNNFHPNIKVTAEYSFETRAVNFLNTKLWIDDQGFIRSDLYVKENKKNQYLLPSSCHPAFQTDNIPFSLCYTIRRICWNDELFLDRCKDLKRDLLERNYRPRSIDAAIKRAFDIPRVEALKKVEKVDKISGRVRFKTVYDPRFPAISDILKKHHKIMLEKDNRLQKIFSQPPVVCYSRPRNLRDELVRAKLPRKTGRRSSRKKPDGFFKCLDVSCRQCPYAEGGPGVRGQKGRRFPSRDISLVKATMSSTRATATRRTEPVPTGPNMWGKRANGQWIALFRTETQ